MKIFILLSRFPYPLEKGDKLRAYNQIRSLSQKHEIHLCALSDVKIEKSEFEELTKYCTTIKALYIPKNYRLGNLFRSIFNGLPFQVGYFYNKKIKTIIHEYITKIKPDLIYSQLIRVSEYTKDLKDYPKVLDYMDAFSKGIERRIEKEPFFMRPIFRFELRRLLRYEKYIFKFFDVKTIISTQDRGAMPHGHREEIKVIPNGVDLNYFHPFQKQKQSEERENEDNSPLERGQGCVAYDILFCGNMGYPPNIFSAEYLAKKVVPLLIKQKPDLKVLIAGANPSKRVKALQSSHIDIQGWVDDIRETYWNSGIFVAPMEMSIGLQNKLLEAMAMRVPVVTSTLANNAIGAIPNESVLIANSSTEYAEKIMWLLNNPKEAEGIAENALKFVRNNYSWDAINEKLSRIFEELQKPLES